MIYLLFIINFIIYDYLLLLSSRYFIDISMHDSI